MFSAFMNNSRGKCKICTGGNPFPWIGLPRDLRYRCFCHCNNVVDLGTMIDAEVIFLQSCGVAITGSGTFALAKVRYKVILAKVGYLIPVSSYRSGSKFEPRLGVTTALTTFPKTFILRSKFYLQTLIRV
jgi:hypothetical protein